MGCGTLAVYAAWVVEPRPHMPHRLRLPAVRHMDCRIPQTCTARLEPHYSSTATPSAQRFTSNTEAYRQKSIPYPTPQPKNSKQPRHNVSHPTPKHTDKSQHRITHHNPRTPKKSPRGVQRGRGFTAPLRFSTASQSKKTRPSAKKSKLKPKTNHTINKDKENHKEK